MIDPKTFGEELAAIVKAATAPLIARIDEMQEEAEKTAARIGELENALAAIPSGPQGDPGPAGKDGEKGADGIGLAGALIDRDGQLVVTLTNGEAKQLGPVVGKDGERGNDGSDGFGFEDLELITDEAGRAVAKFQRGDVVKSIVLPGFVDRGGFKAGTEYLRGDAVTFGGCLWIAQKDAPEGKPAEGECWRLAVRKGRDGRDTEAKKVL